jgi:hypothetical protein
MFNRSNLVPPARRDVGAGVFRDRKPGPTAMKKGLIFWMMPFSLSKLFSPI